MFEQHDAIVRLLRDNDPATVALLKNQLVESGPEIITHLRDLCAIDDATVSRHAHDVLMEIEGRQALEDFTLLCHLFPDHGDIEDACWQLSRVLSPGTDIEPRLRLLDIWGQELQRRLAPLETPRARVTALTNFLATDLGFHGNAERYYDVTNSLLPHVIDTKLGIPISLAVVYLIVAGRAGLRLEGINLPGHFIVRHGGIFFDPFHRGKVLLPADCEAILRKQKLAFQPSYLEPANPRMILTRILANLLYIYQDAGDDLHHGRVAGWLKALERK